MRVAPARLAWEAVLLVLALVATAFAAAQGHFFTADGLWPQLAVTALLASALALSLRAGTPNLAFVAVATLAQLLYVLLVDVEVPPVAAAAVAVLAVALLGALLALLTALTGLPAWAVSLAGVAIASLVGLAGGNARSLHAGL